MLKKIEGILIIILMLFLFTTLFIRLIGVKTYVVESDSMAPSYRLNDLVYINTLRKPSSETLHIGDIVAFNQNSKLVMHRVVELSDTKLITKGDNNEVNDPAIYYNQVQGKVVFRIPFGGYILNIYVWIILVGLYIACQISHKIFKELKEGRS